MESYASNIQKLPGRAFGRSPLFILLFCLRVNQSHRLQPSAVSSRLPVLSDVRLLINCNLLAAGGRPCWWCTQQPGSTQQPPPQIPAPGANIIPPPARHGSYYAPRADSSVAVFDQLCDHCLLHDPNGVFFLVNIVVSSLPNATADRSRRRAEQYPCHTPPLRVGQPYAPCREPMAGLRPLGVP